MLRRRTMKRLCLALVLVLMVAVAIPARAEANHTLAHKVSNLVKKVNRLQSEINCLRRTGATTLVGYAWYEGSLDPGGGPYPVHSEAEDFFDTNFATVFTQAVGGPADYWLSAVNNTRTCRNKFPVIRNPYGSPAPRMAALQLSRIAR
jgi:hypothetical protein